MLSLNLPSLCKANEVEALTKAAEAFYIQAGIKPNVEELLKDFEKKHIPPIVAQNSGVLYFIANTAIQNKLEYKVEWKF